MWVGGKVNRRTNGRMNVGKGGWTGGGDMWTDGKRLLEGWVKRWWANEVMGSWKDG